MIRYIARPGLPRATDRVLLHLNGANGANTTIDEYGNTVVLTSATLSTTQAKFGASSLSLLSATNYRADVGSLTPNSAAWTMECFQFVPAGNTWRGTPFELINGSIYGFQMFFSDNTPTSTYFQVRLSTNGTSWDQAWTVTAGPDLAKDTWQHIAACYDGSNGHLYTYSNGVKVDDHECPAMCATSNLRVGADRAGNCVNAFIDEFRLSNFCRYPGGVTFAPPTAPFES